MKKPAENLWTLADVSDFLRVRPRLVKYWVRTDRIPYVRLGRQVRFEEGEIREWLKDRMENGQFRGLDLREVI